MRIPFREDYVALHISLVRPKIYANAVQSGIEHKLSMRSANQIELCSRGIFAASFSSLQAWTEQAVLSSIRCAGLLYNPGHIFESP